MVADRVEICNMALALCGTRRITAMDNPSREARVCNDNYDICRRTLLRKHRWNFATKRTVLDTVSPTAPAFGFEYAFPLPDDCIRIYAVYSGTAILDEVMYRVEGKNLLSDSSQLWLKYIWDIQTTVEFDPLFDRYLAATLAETIHPQINGSAASLELIQRQLKDAKREAKFVDGVEDPPEEFDADVWIASRNNFNGGFVRDPMT